MEQVGSKYTCIVCLKDMDTKIQTQILQTRRKYVKLDIIMYASESQFQILPSFSSMSRFASRGAKSVPG